MAERKPIRLLDDTVINKIAAGEVVERPASVIKELMENALDAGATRIEVSVVEGGQRLMRVEDNGCGMTRDDALLSVERHATSKVRDMHDVESVTSMGFRGEALAVIPSVSRFILRTRVAENDGGTEVLIEGGRFSDVRDAGCPPGTTIEVRNLFYNVPARRKFLRSIQTETAHIRQLFLMYALAFPEVGMTLTLDDRPDYQLPAGLDMDERLHQLFDRTLVRSLRPVNCRQGEVVLRGYTADPTCHRSDRNSQYIFINRRPASAPLVGYAIQQSYQNLLPKGRYPVVILFIELPPDRVDVNVHPAKKEVRFRSPQEVRDGIMAALTGALRQRPEEPQDAEAGATPPDPQLSATPDRPFMPPLSTAVPPPVKHHTPTFPYPRLGPDSTHRAPTPPTQSAPIPPPWEERSGSSKSPWGAFRQLGVVGTRYLVLETDDGLVLLDPQAAHERLLFERLIHGYERKKLESQGLLAPETVQLTPTEANAVCKNLNLLESMGFGISEFGADTFLVDALPACFGDISAHALLRDMAAEVERAGSGRGGGKWSPEVIARAACRTAVHSKRALTEPEMKRLVEDLAKADMPYTCPHGRPTVIFMSFNEMDRKFGKK